MGIFKPIEVAFRQKVSKVGGCWRWLGRKNDDGYAILKCKSAHRWSYSNFVGNLKTGFEIDHTCNNRDCVNPKHLKQVTHLENVRRAIKKGSYKIAHTLIGKLHASKTHCKRGHSYSGSNLKIEKYGDVVARRCAKCESIKFKKYQNKMRNK